MSNLSQQKVEGSLAGEKVAPTTEQSLLAENIKLQNRITELEGVVKTRDSRILDLLEENEELLNNGPDDENFDSHTMFGEEVCIQCERIDIKHFFESLAEVSKNFNPYQLEEMIKTLPR